MSDKKIQALKVWCDMNANYNAPTYFPCISKGAFLIFIPLLYLNTECSRNDKPRLYVGHCFDETKALSNAYNEAVSFIVENQGKLNYHISRAYVNHLLYKPSFHLNLKKDEIHMKGYCRQIKSKVHHNAQIKLF